MVKSLPETENDPPVAIDTIYKPWGRQPVLHESERAAREDAWNKYTLGTGPDPRHADEPDE